MDIMTEELLAKAISIAYTAHQNQYDKAGKPYICHPMRVMGAMETIPQKIVAILHDVIEDTSITIDDLISEGFNSTIIDALDALTHIKHEPYIGYIEKIKKNSLATSVKLKDIADNSNEERLYYLAEETQLRLRKKYSGALKILNKA